MKPLEGKNIICVGPADELLRVEDLITAWGGCVGRVKTFEQMRQALASQPVDLVVVSVCRGCPCNFEFLPPKEKSAQFPPFLVVACGEDIDLYLRAMERGALDCIARPVDQHELERILIKALLEPAETLAVVA